MWQYRVMIHRVPDDLPDHLRDQWEDYYAIHEVYDADNKEGKYGFTKEPIDVGGSSIGDLRRILHGMLRALDRPVLEYHADPEDQT